MEIFYQEMSKIDKIESMESGYTTTMWETLILEPGWMESLL